MSAGRDSTRRRGAAASHDDGGGDGGAMEAQIVQLDLYDSARAKIEANLRWLFGKAYGTGRSSSIGDCSHQIDALLMLLFRLNKQLDMVYKTRQTIEKYI